MDVENSSQLSEHGRVADFAGTGDVGGREQAAFERVEIKVLMIAEDPLDPRERAKKIPRRLVAAMDLGVIGAVL